MGGDTNPSSASSSSSSPPARDEFPSSSSAGSSSALSSAGPPSAAELARIAQQEALMERLMERKLALLEAEYNACINAENRAEQQQTSTEEAARHGYDRVEAAAQQRGRDGEEVDGEDEEEFSPAWTQFKADMEEERLRQQAEGAESDDSRAAGAAGAEESKTDERVHAPLTSDKITSIKSVMSGIKLRPPPWAIGLPEDVWMARILERAGFVRRAAAAQQQQQQQKTQQETEEERNRRKDRKKARKEKRAREAKRLQQQQPRATTAVQAAVSDSSDSAARQQPQPQQAVGSSGESQSNAAGQFAEDFETSFPPAISSPRASPQLA